MNLMRPYQNLITIKTILKVRQVLDILYLSSVVEPTFEITLISYDILQLMMEEVCN